MASGQKGKASASSDTRTKTFAEILETAKPLAEFDLLESPELKRFQGSLIGLAVGDALGASVEFRPHDYMKDHPITEMSGGGTWGLDAGKWTDDTTMTLCLAASLILQRRFNAHDQFVRYRRWLKDGYLSSVDNCFDIGKATRNAIEKFIAFEAKNKNPQFDDEELFFGAEDAAGNGSLMRVAPIPLFFYKCSIGEVFDYTKRATKMTHGDIRAIQASQYFAYLIYKVVRGNISKEELLNAENFLKEFKENLHPDVKEVVRGSYKDKKQGYEDGIRGQGFVLKALEAALWAFYTDENSFEIGVLKAVNLGDDTDTTAAIYGQLAGAFYGLDKIPKRWREKLYKYDFIKAMATELFHVGLSFSKQRSEWSSTPNGSNKKTPSTSDKNKK